MAIIPLLSRQMPLQQAVKHLGWTRQAVVSWLLAFRRWLLELDRTGQWEARVRLGVRVAPLAQCKRCGFEGGFKLASPDPQRRRRIRCPQCGHSRLLAELQKVGQGLDGVVVHDVIDAAVRARSKTSVDMLVLPVGRMARAGALTTNAQQLPRLAEVVLPRRLRRIGLPERREDLELSAFLIGHVEQAFSPSTVPAPCPWCGSEQTEYQSTSRSKRLPGFRCRSCFAHFTRASNTPLVQALARERAWRVLPMLGWQAFGEIAARDLGMSLADLHVWVADWRRWLLLLDPSGAMEARVGLGLDATGVEPSGQHREALAARERVPRGVQSLNLDPAGLAELLRTAPATRRATLHRKTESTPFPNSWIVWTRARAVKRAQWISRAWKRNSAGDAILSADGYVTKVSQSGELAWRFELRAARMEEVSLARDGYHSSEAARLAAFDAITELLLAQVNTTAHC